MPKPKVVVQKCGLLRKFRRNRGRALLFAAAATSGSLLPANTSQANTNVYFSDPNTNTSVADDWSVGTNWSPAGVPNSASDDVWIYGGSNGFPSSYANVSPVTDDYTASVDQVLVDSAGLNIENGVSLTMNQEYVGESSFAGLYNYGTLNINTGSNSALFVGFASTSIANDFNYGTTNINAAFIGYGGRGNYQNEGGTDNFGTLEVGAEAESTSIGSFGIDSSSSVVTANAEYVGTADGGASSISQSLGSNTIAGALTIASTGTYNLGGGTLTTASISVASGGTFNWTAGTLNITNSTLTVGTGGPLGSNLTLVSGQTLQILGLSNSLFVENGTLNESGDAAITVDDYIDVGNSGTGTVNQSGGTDLTNYLFLGYNSGASGTYNLGGTGALYVDVDEHIGTSGSALFTQNGGTNTAGGTLSIGSSGTYTLSNGMLSAGALNIASGGTFNWTSGTLNITNSSLMVGSGGLFPSLALGSGQTLQISNTNQSLNDNSTISLTGGGQASSSFINIGENSAGVATVTGSGSTLSSSKSLILGGGGTGTLGVSNGGQVSGYEVQIGEGANANVTVDGQGSTLSSSVYIYLGEVGFTSTATLDVTNGAQVSSPFIQLQGGSGSICTAQVSGSGATLSATTECVVGVGSGNEHPELEQRRTGRRRRQRSLGWSELWDRNIDFGRLRPD
jgi:T5SS/PEP-CTERM-associated repeat protein